MKIKKFEISGPDRDGDYNQDVDAEITNTSDQTVKQIRYSATYFTADGHPATDTNTGSEDVSLDPGESTTFHPGGWISNVGADGQDGITIKCRGRLMARNFHKLKEIDIPTDHKSSSKASFQIAGQLLDDDISMRIVREAPDDDGDVKMTVFLAVHNKSHQFIEEAEFKAQMLDEDGAEIDGSYSTENIAPGSSYVFRVGFWSNKASNLKNATLKSQIAIYYEVGSADAEITAKPA
jgi:hypothetical protein